MAEVTNYNQSNASVNTTSGFDINNTSADYTAEIGGISISGLYIPEIPDPNEFYENFTTSLPNNLSIDCGNVSENCDVIKTNIDFHSLLLSENAHVARSLIPAMIFIGILMIVGTVGNAITVYVYSFRFKPATQHFLITCLACFDLLICLIAMPTEIADMRYHHIFSSLAACKLLRFITMFCSISSSFTLVTIAMDRHRRVTKPLKKQISVKEAKIWELANTMGSLFFSWPLLVMTGLRTSQTRIEGLNGTDCSFSDEFAKTKFPLLYNTVLVIGFFTIVLILSIFYFRIWKSATTHRRIMEAKRKASGFCTTACFRSEFSQENRETSQDDNHEKWLGLDVQDLTEKKYGSLIVDKKYGDINHTIIDEESPLASPNTPESNRSLKEITAKQSSGSNTYDENKQEIFQLRNSTVQNDEFNKIISDLKKENLDKLKMKTNNLRDNFDPEENFNTKYEQSVMQQPEVALTRRQRFHSDSRQNSGSMELNTRPMSSLLESFSKYLESRAFGGVELETTWTENQNESDIDRIRDTSKQSTGVIIDGKLKRRNSIDNSLLTKQSLVGSDCERNNSCNRDQKLKEISSEINVENPQIPKTSIDNDTYFPQITRDVNLNGSYKFPNDRRITKRASVPMEILNTIIKPTSSETILSETYSDINGKSEENTTKTKNIISRQSSDISKSSFDDGRRRSTLVSILSKYRNRSSSAVSLDNITLDSCKIGGKKSSTFDKTTIVAFTVTFVFVVSFLPYLSLMFVRAFKKNFDYGLSGTAFCTYNLFLRFYFINSAVNPILYGLLNTRFRNECRKIIDRIFSCKVKSSV